ncbi:lipoate--protein ligase family protein [Desulfurococcus sp.]|jgi:lipoate-protein ligase A|uniref:lipoate--protein ligase family protein n=1 Tax=Desulfurococcus sp. TaxID=51678 RepID=UPI003161CF72
MPGIAVMKLRVIIDLDGWSAFLNMGMDEALLNLRMQEEIPDTLRLYVFDPSAVTIGYFQKIEESVDMDYASFHRIDVTRRISGGGSVYHDRNGEITYSIVTPARGVFSDVRESYEVICKGLIEALKLFGVEASFMPVNDIVVNGRKISGSAQARRRGYLLQHGTLMYATDLDTVSKVLKAPPVKLVSKGVKSIRERVITLQEALSRRVSKEEVAEALLKGFSKALNAEIYIDEYSEKELKLAEELSLKYKSREWVFKR